jgi:hypothetical protein
MTTHPSFLELDQLAAGAGTEPTRAHLMTCAFCSAHVSRVQVEVPIPSWVRQPAQRGWSRIWVWPLTATCAVALVASGFALRAHRITPDLLAEKGGPALALYVKRGTEVLTWDEKQVLKAGDLLRLQVAPEGHSHVTIDSPPAPGHLFDADVPAGTSFLPVSWRVDAAGGPEVLEVTFSGGSVPAVHTRLVLPKARP